MKSNDGDDFHVELHKMHTSSIGFEPMRGDPNGFLGHRLNHSATTTRQLLL